jgi:integrase
VRYHHANLANRFKAMCDRARVPRIRFHDLRHTHATIMLGLGQYSKMVSDRLGHSSIQITLDTYSHVLPDMQQGAADAFGAAVFGAKAS